MILIAAISWSRWNAGAATQVGPSSDSTYSSAAPCLDHLSEQTAYQPRRDNCARRQASQSATASARCAKARWPGDGRQSWRRTRLLGGRGRRGAPSRGCAHRGPAGMASHRPAGSAPQKPAYPTRGVRRKRRYPPTRSMSWFTTRSPASVCTVALCGPVRRTNSASVTVRSSVVKARTIVTAMPRTVPRGAAASPISPPYR